MSDCERCGAAIETPKRLTCNGRTWGVFCVDCHDLLARVGAGDGVLEADRDDPELTLVLSTAGGQTRRLRIREAVEPGVAYALEEAEWTGCSFRVVGREQLDRVEIDGDVWHEADRTGAQGCTRGP